MPKPKKKPKPEPAPPAPLDRERMPLDVAARTLSADGGVTITKAMLEADVKAGAPTNADGTIGQISYLAWLLKQGD